MHSLQERRFFPLISTYVEAKSHTYQGTRKPKLDHAPPPTLPPAPWFFDVLQCFEKIWLKKSGLQDEVYIMRLGRCWEPVTSSKMTLSILATILDFAQN